MTSQNKNKNLRISPALSILKINLTFVIERLFGKTWREEFVVLYEDSSVIWFCDRDKLEPEGRIYLRDAPEMLAAGQVH